MNKARRARRRREKKDIIEGKQQAGQISEEIAKQMASTYQDSSFDMISSDIDLSTAPVEEALLDIQV